MENVLYIQVKFKWGKSVCGTIDLNMESCRWNKQEFGHGNHFSWLHHCLGLENLWCYYGNYFYLNVVIETL